MPSQSVPKGDVDVPALFNNKFEQLRNDIKEELQKFLAALNTSGFNGSRPDVAVSPLKKRRNSLGALELALQPSAEREGESKRTVSKESAPDSPGSPDSPLYAHEALRGTVDEDMELWNHTDDEEHNVMSRHNVLCHRVSIVLADQINDPASITANQTEDARSVRKSNEEKWLNATSEPFMPTAYRPRAWMIDQSYERMAAMGPEDSEEHGSLLNDGHVHFEDDDAGVSAVSLSAVSTDKGGEAPPLSPFASIVLSLEFEQFIGFLVVLNAVSIGLETDYQAKNVGTDLPIAYKVVDASFCFVFTLELVLKLFILGCSNYFCGGNAAWQVFDFFVVGIQLADYLMKAPLPGRSSGNNGGMNVTVFRLLRLMRLARILRILRIVKTFQLIDDLNTIVSSIAASMKSLLWALSVLFVMIYVVAICFTHLVTDARKAQKAHEEEPEENVLLFYGTLWRTVLTMFECIAGGIHWGEVMEPLMSSVSPWAGALFLVYIAFSVFAMLNVVTGVFVGKAMDCAREKDDDKLIGYLRDIFMRADENGSGEIAWEEFESRLDSDEMREYFKIIDVDMSEANTVFSLIDADGGGSVDPLEFVSGCLRLRGPAKAVELSLLMYETKKMNQWLKSHVRILEQRVTWIGNLLKRANAETKDMREKQASKVRGGRGWARKAVRRVNKDFAPPDI